MGNAVDTLQLLQTFVRVADTGSLSAAARALGTTQPSVSRQLRALESRLGVTLAQRSTQELTLTAEGADLLPRARALLSDWEETQEALQSGEGEPTGLLRVVAPTALGPLFVASDAARFTHRHPGVDVDLIFSDANIDLVSIGADFQLKVGAVERQDLLVRRIGEIPGNVVVASDLDLSSYFPKSGDVRPGFPVVALAPLQSSVLTLQDDHRRSVSYQGRLRLQVETLAAAHEAILAGGGVGILPNWLIREDLKAGRLRIVFPEHRPSPPQVSMVFPPGRFRPLRTRLFAEIVEATIRAKITG